MSGTESNVVSVYKEHESEFTKDKEIEAASRYFGKPQLMGKSLDALHSTEAPGFAATVMPGIVLGSGSSAESTPSYYLAYTNPGDDDSRKVWFHVKVNSDGEEVIVDHGVA
ncbi:hypothetical protein IW140_000607 [Coemansia sp. RSA 1813]|nr:hypothetical protein EV178_002662 [Coemansia sp. RSA 1646]KAJ1774076.1 hypothetical protein LPJ74_000175 [Coemansia sp. RSA 1843]KAJ2092533.1 hypothetical protein IW138_000971 [Coemansia sp. RSA 986]KAJ2216772.1 hypothetical protein EV179_001062 [Coemansia sp. RSA 487]KAJ2572844.1 hypothetical protein IW140_000607 [Coemansia sp. RSA 1813]